MRTSRGKLNWMRALIEALLVAISILVLGNLHIAVAETPLPPSYRSLSLMPLEFGLQGRLVLVNPLPAPGFIGAPRVMLPKIAPAPAPPPAATLFGLDPDSLLRTMRAALLPSSPIAAPGPIGPPRPLALPSATWTTQPAPMPAMRPAEPVGAPEQLQLATHHSLVVNSPVPLTRVSMTDDSIAQAIVVSPNQVLIQGIAPGEVSLLLWDANSQARAYTVQVGLDPMPLQRELLRLYPRQLLKVTASGDALVVTGVLENAASAKQVLDIAGGFSKNIVNNLSVDAAADPEQVLLQVKFIEVDRSAVTQLGANLFSTAPGLVGSVSTQQFSPPPAVLAPPGASQVPGGSIVSSNGAAFGLDNLLNVFLFNSNAKLGLTLQALQQQNLLQILAEPNLVAMDGKQASFLAGGEFPFPVVQGQGAVNSVTIQFKPFGVNLHFTPNILADGTIDLQVAPEVSALDFTNAVTISGFQVPALSTRRAETELELNDGQSFVIAGLMDNRLTNDMSKLPGLSEIPVLGKFFESRTTNKSRTELMVVVTAHLVHAANTAPAGPRMAQPFLLPDKFDAAVGGKGGAH